jgi:predicted dehydrogenase
VQALDWKLWLGSAPDQPFNEERFHHWRWFWNFGGGAMTDLFSHWIDVVHWAMKSDQPREAHMLADKYVFEQWDCPDTIQAAFRYPGFDVGYDGMMNSSVDDGGLEFRGTEATLKLNRSGFSVYREGVQEGKIRCSQNAVSGTAPSRTWRISWLASKPQRANAPVETVAARWPHRQPGLPSRWADGVAS